MWSWRMKPSALPLSLRSLDALLTRGDMAEIVYRIRTGNDRKPSHTYSSIYASNNGANGNLRARYVAYEDGVIGNGRESVLFFHAAWCPNCRQTDAELSRMAAEGKLIVSVYKVDYDTAADLKARYGVTVQDTLVRIGAEGETMLTRLNPTVDDLELLTGSY